MGNEIRLEQLGNNEALKQLWNKANADGDDKLEGDEIIVFNSFVDGAGLEESSEFKALGLELSTAKASTTTPPEMEKGEVKRHYDDVKKQAKEIAKNTTSYNFLAELNSKYLVNKTNNTINPEYKEMLDEVHYVFNKVHLAEGHSKESVDKIYDTVQKQLKADKKWDGFHKDILNILVDQAKKYQIEVEYLELSKKYDEEYRKDKTTGEYSNDFETTLKKFEDDLKKKGADGKKAWDKSYTKEAFEKLKARVKEQGYEVAKDGMQAIYDKVDAGTAGEKEVKTDLKALKNKDKYINDGVKELKDDRNVLKRGGKYNDRTKVISHISRKDAQDMLGKDLFDKLNTYIHKQDDDGNYLYVNADGTYNLSELQAMVKSRVGSNFQADRSSDDFMSEIKNVKRYISGKTGADLSDGDAKKLIKFAEIKYQGKDRTPKIVKAVVNGISGLIGAVGANSTLKVTQEVSIKMVDAAATEEMKQQLTSQGIQFTETKLSDGTLIKVLQQYISDNTLKNLATGLVSGLVIGALFDVILGEDPEEMSCMSVSDYDIKDSTYTNADEYKEYVGNVFAKAPAKVKALHALIDAFVEKYGDKWHEEFQNSLRSDAGIGSKLNPEECRMLKYEAKKVKETKPTPPTPPTPPPTPPTPPTQKCKVETRQDIRLDGKEGRINSSKYYWDELINMFYKDCLKENGGTHTMKEIRFKLREINNIPHNYPSVPSGIVMPYDLFGDGECTRTEQQDVTLRKRVKPTGNVKVLIMKAKSGWQYGTQCPGDDKINWNTNEFFKSEAEARHAGNEEVGLNEK